MNWKEIKNKHPKSFKVLNDWEGIKADPNRFLYDFFDEQEIYVFPLRGERHFNGIGFGYEIQAEKRHRQHGFKSRSEAEEQAFLKAFEILENNLK